MDNKKEINGRTFTFGVIPATEAVYVEIALAKLLGDPLEQLAPFLDPKKSKIKSDGDMMKVGGAAIASLVKNADPAEVVKLMQDTFKYVGVDGERCNIDTHFTGKNRDLWLVLFEALKFNFADFFPASLLHSLRKKIVAE